VDSISYTVYLKTRKLSGLAGFLLLGKIQFTRFFNALL
jgi:hypothetical protein